MKNLLKSCLVGFLVLNLSVEAVAGRKQKNSFALENCSQVRQKRNYARMTAKDPLWKTADFAPGTELYFSKPEHYAIAALLGFSLMVQTASASVPSSFGENAASSHSNNEIFPPATHYAVNETSVALLGGRDFSSIVEASSQCSNYGMIPRDVYATPYNKSTISISNVKLPIASEESQFRLRQRNLKIKPGQWVQENQEKYINKDALSSKSDAEAFMAQENSDFSNPDAKIEVPAQDSMFFCEDTNAESEYRYDADRQIKMQGGIRFRNLNGRKIVGVIDAGSSGSRAILYELDASNRNERVYELITYKSEPGLSSLSPANSNESNLYVKRLIDGFKAKVELYNNITNSSITLSNVPVYLLATAGMRNTRQEERNAIFANIYTALIDNNVLLKTCGTIEGSNEGVYAWIAANFNSRLSNDESRLGLIEIGGASVQVVFEDHQKNSKYVHAKRINGKEYYLYIYSYPAYGNEEIQKALLPQSIDSCRGDNAHARQCIKAISSLFVKKRGDLSCPTFGMDCEAQQPEISNGMRFALAGVPSYVKKQFIDEKIEQHEMNRKSLLEAADFCCAHSVKEIIAKMAVNNEHRAGNGCYQASLVYSILFGDNEIDADNQDFYGIGVNADLDLVADRDTNFPIGFILTNLNDDIDNPELVR